MMKRKVKAIGHIALLALLCVPCILQGQYKPDQVQALSQKYHDQGHVLLNGERTYHIQRSENGIFFTLEVLEEHLINKAGIFDQSSDAIFIDETYMSVEELDAYSLVPTGKKYKKMPVKDFFKEDQMAAHEFTSDAQTMNFYFPEANAGTITHLSYRFRFKGVEFIPPAFAGDYYPLHRSKVKVIVDEGIELAYQYFNLEASEAGFTQREERGKTIYEWEFKETEVHDPFGNAPNLRYFMPHIMFRIKGQQVDGNFEPYLNDLSDLHRLYRSWIDQVESAPDTLIAFVAEELALGQKTDMEKLTAIFQWTQKNIKYIAFSDGMKGLVPQSAMTTVECRYGDCKAMSYLMHELATAVGVQTHLTWIGSRDLPYSYDEFPSPAIDNHMILSYVDEDSVIFLDATDSHVPFGLPSSFTQGKQAFISLGDDEYMTAQVPVVQANSNHIFDSVRIHLHDRDLVGSGKAILSGYHAVRFHRRARGLDNDERERLVKSMVRKGDDRFRMDGYELDIQHGRDEIIIDYQFTIPDYVSSFGDQRFINMNLEEYFAGEPIEDERLVPIEFDNTWSTKMIAHLDLEPGQTVQHVPENDSKEASTFGYSLQYASSENSLRYEIDTYCNSLFLPPTSFSEWNETKKELRMAQSQNLIIKHVP